MKSYTDLEQSKKLVGILPLESADMIIVSIGDREGAVTTTMPKETFNMLRTPFVDIRETTPCWSLAALLEELNRNCWNVSLKCCGAEWDMTYDDGERYISVPSDYAIDACVEMIIKLHEQKLLQL